MEEILYLTTEIQRHQLEDNLFLPDESQDLASNQTGAFFFEDLPEEEQIAIIDEYLKEGR